MKLGEMISIVQLWEDMKISGWGLPLVIVTSYCGLLFRLKMAGKAKLDPSGFAAPLPDFYPQISWGYMDPRIRTPVLGDDRAVREKVPESLVGRKITCWMVTWARNFVSLLEKLVFSWANTLLFLLKLLQVRFPTPYIP